MNDDRHIDESGEHSQEEFHGSQSGDRSDASPTARAAGTDQARATQSALSLPAEEVKQLAVDVLRTIYDPEIPVNIYDLGLIYDIAVDDNAEVVVSMTLTTPACPVAGSLPPEVERKLRSTPGITDARVDLTWDPPWDYRNLSDEIKLQLGLL